VQQVVQEIYEVNNIALLWQNNFFLAFFIGTAKLICFCWPEWSDAYGEKFQ
jgi:hypothetical protein